MNPESRDRTELRLLSAQITDLVTEVLPVGAMGRCQIPDRTLLDYLRTPHMQTVLTEMGEYETVEAYLAAAGTPGTTGGLSELTPIGGLSDLTPIGGLSDLTPIRGISSKLASGKSVQSEDVSPETPPSTRSEQQTSRKRPSDTDDNPRAPKIPAHTPPQGFQISLSCILSTTFLFA